MYVCGPTVYDEPHIGHARSAYIFDIIRRYLVYRGYKVRFVRNVTDVDDKIIDRARKDYPAEDLNSAVQKVSQKYLDSYHHAMQSLGILVPDVEPKATEYVSKDKPLMQEFISNLIQRGAAYVSGGDVYFDITKAKDYGKLSNQSLDKMESGSRISPGENKKNPLDFALWKAVKENEPSWDSPWGKGRPGWHIECSVMSSEILGDEFDIHGGGIDLIFPHHENEIAQSEGAGKNFARIWIHHGLLTINGQKMAKSLGNFVTIKEVLDKHPSDILKIFYLQACYSSPIDFTWEKLEEAKKAYEGIDILRRKLEGIYGTKKIGEIIHGGAGDLDKFKNQFIEYMDDDFNTPRALSVLFDMVHGCNKLLESKDRDNLILNYAMEVINEIINVFGLSFLDSPVCEIPNDRIEFFVSTRLAYKRLKKYKEADEIRKDLEAKGIILEDSKDGKTTWRRRL